MSESHQKKLTRVRAPKVKIAYEVDTGDAIQKRELAMVVGVLADLNGGQPVKDKNGKPLRIDKRKFVDIDRDNFNDVLAASGARITGQVDDKLSGEEGKKLAMDLEIKSMEDFHPENVAQQIPALRELVDARKKLAALKATMDGNPDLAEKLNEIIQNADLKDSLKSKYASEPEGEGSSDDAPAGEGEGGAGEDESAS